MMTTPDLDLAMQLDFNAYPDSFGNLDHQDFDASRFDHMRSNGSYAGSMPSMSTGTTPSSFSNTAPPSLQDCDSLFWSPYPSLGNDITMDISTYPSAGYEQAAADFTGGTQPATRQDWTNPYAAASSIYIISSQLIGAEDNNNNKFFDPYVPVSAMNASYQPAHLYDSSDPSYPPSISMTAFSHTASPAEKMPSASPGLDNGYLTTPASSGRKYVANHRTMGPMQYCQGSSARSGRQPRTQQGSRANGYAPMIPSGLSRTSTPAMSPGLGQVQVGSVVDVGGAGIGDVQDAQSWNIDPQLYEAGELFSGSGDGNVMEEAVSSADTAEYMDFVTRT